MAQISINLLPIEFTQEEVKRAKFFKVQTAGVAVILFMTFLTSLTIALRILQSQNIRQVQAQVTSAEGRVGEFKDTQASLLLLKNRLGAISQFLDNPSKQSEIYNLVSSLLPPAISLASVSVDPDGGVSLVALAYDIVSLENFISGLNSAETNQGKVSEVSVEGLSRNRDGIYRVTLQIKSN